MYFNALQRQNFADKNFVLHIMMVVNARCWVWWTL